MNSDTRFIVIDTPLWKNVRNSGLFDDYKNLLSSDYNLMIADHRYYIDHESDIIFWLDKTDIRATITGMLLSFNSAEDRTTFLMRWG